MTKQLLILIGILLFAIPVFAQVGIGTSSPNANSILDLNSTNKGLLLPRVTFANRPANTTGLILYQTDGTPGMYVNDGSAYSKILYSAGTANYLQKVSSGGDLQNSLIYDNGTNVGIGTTSPDGRFKIDVDATNPPIPIALRVTSSWDPTSVTGDFNAYGMHLVATGTLDNAQGGNGGTFTGSFVKMITAGSTAGSTGIQNTFGQWIYASASSNGQSVLQVGSDIESMLENSKGNIISNYGIRIVTGVPQASFNSGANQGVINNNYGIVIGRPNNTGDIFNNYGLYIGNQNGVGTTVNYPIYYNGPSGAAYLSATGTWTNACDSTGKENIVRVNTSEILDKICRLPVSYWNYKQEKGNYRHVSPMAQDFQAIFDVGYKDNTISLIDPSGISLAGIQELARRNAELQKTIEAQQVSIDQLQKQNEEILKRLHHLEASVH
ncbi:MAG TPA: tail fiber domain-containing protein [Bacteroidales bacterium]|nr:tail fiber domain-containing protein [Bacteroidales bacterium]